METTSVTLELPVNAPLSATVRALEAARDAQTDSRAKQALAMAAALASRGLIENLAKSINHRAVKANQADNHHAHEKSPGDKGQGVEVVS